MADQDETFFVTIQGRSVEFHPPNSAQILLVNRLVRRFGDPQAVEEGFKESGAKVLDQMSKILDVIDSMVNKAEDRDWLESRIIEGSLDLEELLEGFQIFVKEEQNRQDRRTAKKTTKKAAARKTTPKKTARKVTGGGSD